MHIDSEERKRVIRLLFEDGWNQEKFLSFSAHIGKNVKFNFRGGQQITNVEDLKNLVAFWRKAFPDLEFQVLSIIVENELAAANLIFTGTHLGDWMGLKSSEKKIKVEEMMFFRFEEGKIVELWEVYDEALMMKQITPD